jgi:SAM-dependent methyltransferase
MSEIDYRNVFQNDNASAYDELTGSKHIRLIYELEKEVLDRVFKEGSSSEKDLMDFACGSGRWTRFLEGYFKSSTGVDISGQMIEIAKTKCERSEFVVTDITSDSVDEGLADRQFDVITTFRFFKNAQEQLRRSALAGLRDYLKDDGVLIFDVHLNSWSIMGLLARLISVLGLKKVLKTGELMVRTMSLGDVKRMFADGGFEIVDYWGMGVLPGRSNYILLPWGWLRRLEGWFTGKKILRGMSYNLLILAKKKG